MMGSGKTMLYLICDLSGSMAEGGKRLLVRGIVRAVEQYVRLGYAAADIKLVLWKANAAIADWNQDDEVPAELLQCSGSASVDAITELLDEKPSGRVLLLTDGWWTSENDSALKKWKQALPLDTIHIIKIGGDANPRLEGDDVFSAEDFFSALDGWLTPTNQDTFNFKNNDDKR